MGTLKRTSISLIPTTDAPQMAGERRAAITRVILAPVFLLFVGGYLLYSSDIVRNTLYITAGLITGWGLMSSVVLYLIYKRKYNIALSYFTTSFDVVAVSVAQIIVMAAMPLSFVFGPISSCYFIMIGLATLRKSRTLVLFSGVAAAVMHLTISLLAYTAYMPGGYLLTTVANYPVELSFLDEVIRAAVMAGVGVLFSRVTKELRESERHYLDLFENVPDGVTIATRDHRILICNQRFADLVGEPTSRLIGRHVSDFLRTEATNGSSYDTPVTPPTLAFMGNPTILLRADGSEVDIRSVSHPVEYRGIQCIETSVRDVTVQIQLERQLLQSQKMETLGRLAGGLAHDFNNILGGIIGASSLLERNIARASNLIDTNTFSRQVDIIKECGDRARDVVSRLLSFSRSSPIAREPVDLNQIVADVEVICVNTFDRKIEISARQLDHPCVVEGDATSITQALLNLCINAKDAMPEGGNLQINISDSTTNEKIRALNPDATPNSTYWCVEVSDTGVGIDVDHLDRIFEPFFTTKPAGEGTGLGLSMVYNIARQHGGFVDINSMPDEGTTFYIYLAQATPSVIPDEIPSNELPTGKARIIVVDDEEIIRSAVSGMLRELGYNVSIATDGEEALRLLSAREGDVDLVILDIIMPKMNGVDLLSIIKDEYPSVKTVAMSGFLSEDRLMALQQLRVNGILKKPFALSHLAHKVADVLNAD